MCENHRYIYQWALSNCRNLGNIKNGILSTFELVIGCEVIGTFTHVEDAQKSKLTEIKKKKNSTSYHQDANMERKETTT